MELVELTLKEYCPAAVNNFLPAGILGIVLTGLLGAFMGTFLRNAECCTGLYRQRYLSEVYKSNCLQPQNNFNELFVGHRGSNDRR